MIGERASPPSLGLSLWEKVSAFMCETKGGGDLLWPRPLWRVSLSLSLSSPYGICKNMYVVCTCITHRQYHHPITNKSSTENVHCCVWRRRRVCVVHARAYTSCLVDPWLILPVVICLSQRLSHACLSPSCVYTARPRTAH